jgi:hypothetical protein
VGFLCALSVDFLGALSVNYLALHAHAFLTEILLFPTVCRNYVSNCGYPPAMREITLLILAACLLSSCDNYDTKTIDAGEFTIEVPEDWSYEQRVGYDSYVAGVEMGEGQEAFFDLGLYGNPLNVDVAVHSIVYETIDGKRAKLVSPKSIGKGTTGVYFDSLEVTRTTRFHLSGTDLSKSNQKLLEEAIRTLRFKN